MKIASVELIADLVERTRQNLNEAEALRQMPFDVLNHKPDHNTWSALECFEHLNLYGDFYLPEIRQQIKSRTHQSAAVFKSGLLGNYFAKSMLPKDKLNKMKTFKDKNPNGSNLSMEVIDRFIHQQKQMLDLLNDARHVNLHKTKTAISIASFIKLRLGDTFRVVIYHNQRHLVQAQSVIKTAQTK